MLPMSRINCARRAYINEYGAKQFNEELLEYIKSTGKTVDKFIEDEIKEYGEYNIINVHLRFLNGQK